MDAESISEVNDRLLLECRHYIEHAGRVGSRPRTVKEMTEEERPHLIPLPAKRYEVGVHAKASVDNRQLFKFDNCLYSVPRPYAKKEIGIIAYPYRVDMYYKGGLVWGCDRPLFADENRVYAEHYLYDLEIKPRSRENSFPLLKGVLPPELHGFRELCKSRTTKCYQLYMLLRLMGEVGRDRLLKAVGIANAAGDPTYEKVEGLLLLGPEGGAGADPLGQALLGDEFHVERRDTSGYDMLWGGGGRPRMGPPAGAAGAACQAGGEE